MQHLFTTASDQSNWSSRAIQSCQRKRATSFEWQGPVISRNSSSDDTRSTLVASLENCARESRDLMKDTCLDIYTICFQKRVRQRGNGKLLEDIWKALITILLKKKRLFTLIYLYYLHQNLPLFFVIIYKYIKIIILVLLLYLTIASLYVNFSSLITKDKCNNKI